MNEPEQMPEKQPLAIAVEKPSRKRMVVMGVVVALALVALAVLKLGSEQEQAEFKQAKAARDKQIAEVNKEIVAAMGKQYRGPSMNPKLNTLVARVGQAIAEKTDAKNVYPKLKFHLLAEPNSINVIALSSGDVYVTTALVNRMQTEGQLAAALAHGAAHALAGDGLNAIPLPYEDALPMWNYATEAEMKADPLAVKLMGQAGYDPNAMVGMFTVLLNAYQAGADVAFFTTHPNVDGRLEAIVAAVAKLYPQGVPAELSK